MYSDQEREQLRLLVRDEGQLKGHQSQLEEHWLALQEQLEAALED